MKTRLIPLLLLLVFVLSCNLPNGLPTPTVSPQPETDTPVQQPSTQTPLPTETLTPIPTDTPPPTLTFTPSIPVALPKDQNVNCRYGYGTGWVAVGALVNGQPATVVGRNTDSSWWYVQLPDSTKCWVAAGVTDVAGNVVALPIVNQATASVIKVTIDAPEDGPVCPFRATELTGSIETNGPTTVEWYFDTQQNGALTNHTVTLDSFNVIKASDSFFALLANGTYWVRLVVTSPNGKTAETSYQIDC